MTSEQNEIRQTRAVVDQVVGRFHSDPEYAKRFRGDPVGALLAAGIPPNATLDILREEGADAADVAGYALAQPSLTPALTHVNAFDCTVTCIFTEWECHWTLFEAPPANRV